MFNLATVYNTMSCTTKQSFHGKSTLVFQYSENIIEKSFKFDYSEEYIRFLNSKTS